MSEVFRVIIEGDYRAGEAFEMIIKQTGVVKTQIEGMAVAEKRMSVESDVNMERMARGIWRVTSLFAVMDMAMMRVQVAHNILESSQERLDYATEKYGATSRQAIQAQRELERVHNYVSRSYIRAAVAAGSFVLRLVLESNLLKEASLATIWKTITTGAATVVEWMHNHALEAKIILLSALTAGAFAAAAAIGAMAGKASLAAADMSDLNSQAARFQGIDIGGATVALRKAPITFESSIVVEEGVSVEDAIDANARRLKDEYRRRIPG